MITLARYTNVFREEFLIEAYSEETEPNDILDEIIDKNEFFGRKVILRDINRVSFNDGSQVNLLTIPLETIRKEYINHEENLELGEHFGI